MPYEFHKRKRLDAKFLALHPVTCLHTAGKAQNMNENKSQPEAKAPKTDAKSEREARLNEALRENLKKRKSQARARKSAPKSPDSA